MTATPLAVTILHFALATVTFFAGVCLALGSIPALLAALALVVLITDARWGIVAARSSRGEAADGASPPVR